MLLNTAMLSYKTTFWNRFSREKMIFCYTVRYFVFLIIVPKNEIFVVLNIVFFNDKTMLPHNVIFSYKITFRRPAISTV